MEHENRKPDLIMPDGMKLYYIKSSIFKCYCDDNIFNCSNNSYDIDNKTKLYDNMLNELKTIEKRYSNDDSLNDHVLTIIHCNLCNSIRKKQ